MNRNEGLHSKLRVRLNRLVRRTHGYSLVSRAVENQMFPNEWAVVLILMFTIVFFLWVWLRAATAIHRLISSDPVEQAATVMFHTGSAFCVSSLLNNAGEIEVDGIIQYSSSISYAVWVNPDALLGFCAVAACPLIIGYNRIRKRWLV